MNPPSWLDRKQNKEEECASDSGHSSMGELVSSSDEGVVVPKPGCSSSLECSESEESDSDIGMPGSSPSWPSPRRMRGGSQPSRREIIVDSGASKHMIGRKQLQMHDRTTIRNLDHPFWCRRLMVL